VHLVILTFLNLVLLLLFFLVERLKSFALFFLFLQKLLLVLFVHPGKGRVDDCKSQVEKEKRSDEHVESKKDDYYQARSHFVVFLSVAPAFERDVLESHHKCPENVVVVGNAEVGVCVHLAAVVLF